MIYEKYIYHIIEQPAKVIYNISSYLLTMTYIRTSKRVDFNQSLCDLRAPIKYSVSMVMYSKIWCNTFESVW